MCKYKRAQITFYTKYKNVHYIISDKYNFMECCISFDMEIFVCILLIVNTMKHS